MLEGNPLYITWFNLCQAFAVVMKSKYHILRRELLYFFNKLISQQAQRNNLQVDPFLQSIGVRNRVGIGLPYRPARLYRLAESIPWNQILGSLKV
jgi:hypothetical protein